MVSLWCVSKTTHPVYKYIVIVVLIIDTNNNWINEVDVVLIFSHNYRTCVRTFSDFSLFFLSFFLSFNTLDFNSKLSPRRSDNHPPSSSARLLPTYFSLLHLETHTDGESLVVQAANVDRADRRPFTPLIKYRRVGDLDDRTSSEFLYSLSASLPVPPLLSLMIPHL